MLSDRITAAAEHLTMSLVGAETIVASASSRMLSGVVVKFGVPGHTSRGLLKVAPGALVFPDDLTRVKLTREHDRADSRGYLAALDVNAERIRASLKVASGPAGDLALSEADDHTRDGLSFDVVDATIDGDTITSGRVVAIGQVGIPAYDDGRIDTIAAAAASPTVGDTSMLTTEQQARLDALRARTDLSEAETAELNALAVLGNAAATPAAPAPSSTAAPSAVPASQVAASMPSVPSGVPTAQTSSTTTARPAGAAFADFVDEITAGLRASTHGDRSSGLATITAALSDITNTAHQGVIDQPAWSGELWSGLVYEPIFSDLFTSGDLTNWEGEGWRFTNKLDIADYAGDKAAIPTDTVGTESSSYEAARMAVGVDIDRKFFDFPSTGFVESLFAQVRESWAIKLDAKVAAYIAANKVTAKDVEPGGAAIAAVPSLLKAAAIAVRALRRRKVGAASWVLVNDDDLFSLFDVASKDVSAFLELFQIDPANFRSAPAALVPVGTVLAGAKQAATVRTLPGSPIRVEAQSLVNGGVDEAFFGYWAIEEHHTSGIASATFTPA